MQNFMRYFRQNKERIIRITATIKNNISKKCILVLVESAKNITIPPVQISLPYYHTTF